MCVIAFIHVRPRNAVAHVICSAGFTCPNTEVRKTPRRTRTAALPTDTSAISGFCNSLRRGTAPSPPVIRLFSVSEDVRFLVRGDRAHGAVLEEPDVLVRTLVSAASVRSQ